MQSESGKSVHSGHRARVREKINNGALENMHDHEMLEYLLFHTVPYKDTNELAHRLIDHCGSFHAVLDSTVDDLLQVKGVSEVTATFLSSLPTILKRYMEDINKTTKVWDIADIAKVMKMKYVGAIVEKMYMICLDGNMNMLRCELISSGNSREVSVDKRKVMETAIRCNAEYAIIVHNHPNNKPNPSADDIESTCMVKNMLGEIGIKLIDSVIVADGDFISLAKNQRMKAFF